jgi:hypothetical protein
MNFAKLLIRDDVSFHDINLLAPAEGWKELQEYQMKGKNGKYEKVWETCSGKHQLHYIYDGMLQLHYFLIAGENPEEAKEVLAQVIPSNSKEEFIKTFINTDDLATKIRAAHKLAVGSSTFFNENVFNTLLELLQHDNPDVKYEALLGVNYVCWPEFEEHLESIITETVPNHVKQAATLILKNARENGWKT